MKYWNKDKRIRQERWFPVSRRFGTESYTTVKRRLQNYPSTGRFYLYYGSETVWFEHEKDAVWFALTV
jgi:hypothetical protein